jgi:hypothetical protein
MTAAEEEETEGEVEVVVAGVVRGVEPTAKSGKRTADTLVLRIRPE